MIKNIVFDFDGTIADSKNAILKIVNDNHQKYGFEKLSEKRINFLMGKGAKYLIKSLEIPTYKIPFLMKQIKDLMNKNVENLEPFKDMDKALVKLMGKGMALGILTSNSKENVEKFLKKKDLEHFDFIYHGSSLFGKDRMLRKMLKEQRLNKDETAYVGDEDRDVEAAKKVGLTSVAVSWGFNSISLLKKTKPDHLLTKPSELLTLSDK